MPPGWKAGPRGELAVVRERLKSGSHKLGVAETGDHLVREGGLIGRADVPPMSSAECPSISRSRLTMTAYPPCFSAIPRDA